MYAKYSHTVLPYLIEHEFYAYPENKKMDELVLEAKNNDNAKELVLKSMSGFLYKSASALWTPGIEIDDLYQVAVLGCLKAIDVYDENRNCKFITILHPCVYNEIRMYKRRFNKGKKYISYNNTFGQFDDLELLDTLEDIEYSERISNLEDRLDSINIAKILNTLSERDRTIIEYSFGLNGKPEISQAKMSEVMGISQSYVSKLYKRTLLKLRNILKNYE